jgi:DNA-binding NarL/FixJ family response regulator
MTAPKHILLVDDDAHWRKLITEILTDAGCAVTASASAPDPLPPCHLAILDGSLDPKDEKNRDGFSLAARMGATPVILLSGIPAAELAEATRGMSNIIGWLDKGSFSPDKLLTLARPVLEESADELRALIVEDDAGWRAIYADVLADSGYRLEYAVSYGEARGQLQRTPFAFAIVDLHLISSADPLENRDGFWLLRATQQRSLPTIVVSALGAPDDIDKAYDEYGVFAFVEKEAFDRKAFLRTIQDAVRTAHTAATAARVESSSAAEVHPLAALTEREHEVLELMSQGFTNKEIATRLVITPNTVKKHVDHILQKLEVSTRAAATAIAVRAGLEKK